MFKMKEKQWTGTGEKKPTKSQKRKHRLLQGSARVKQATGGEGAVNQKGDNRKGRRGSEQLEGEEKS